MLTPDSLTLNIRENKSKLFYQLIDRLFFSLQWFDCGWGPVFHPVLYLTLASFPVASRLRVEKKKKKRPLRRAGAQGDILKCLVGL